jgi:DNA-binding MarR family transcriptional regulator
MSKPAPNAAGARAASPAAVSELESHVGFWLRFVANHVSAGFEAAMQASGCSVSEWVALRQLFGAGSASPAELMEALGMTKGAVSKIVTRLEDKGLVERASSEADGRARQVVLTRAGRQLVPKLARLADSSDASFFGHLSVPQRRRLMSMLQGVVHLHGLKRFPSR